MDIKNTIIELNIDGISSEGEGVGHSDGMAVFVKCALPGECVQVRIKEQKKRFCRGELLQILTAAKERQEPLCPVADRCGGCDWQHVDYTAELALKRDIVSQTLRRIGKLPIDVPEILPALQMQHYRNRVILHAEDGGRKLGFFGGNSHDLCEYDACALLMPPLLDLQQALRQVLPAFASQLGDLRAIALRCNSGGDAMLLTFICEQPLSLPLMASLAKSLQQQEPRLQSIWQNSGAPIYGAYGAQWQHIAGQEKLDENLADLQLQLAPGSFSQVNPKEALRLYELLGQWLNLAGKETVLDLYSGVGSIALFLARQAGKIIGIEQYAPAAMDAAANARLNNITNCRFIAAAAEQALPALMAEGEQPAVVVLDPPRAGCDAALLENLLQLQPARIVYVSCAPATLARDLRILSAGGQYQVCRLQCFDMFPRTAHVETVVLLSHKSPDSHINVKV